MTTSPHGRDRPSRTVRDTRAVTADDICRVLTGAGPAIVFQPIFRGTDLQVAGYEALARFPTTKDAATVPDAEPEEWFDAAAGAGLSGVLEGAALLRALDAAEVLPPEHFLAVNLSAAALASDPLLAEPIRQATRRRRIVLEITERSTVTEVGAVLHQLDSLRAEGVVIALDDVGAGNSGLRQVITVRPDMIKVDAFITRGIGTDPLRQDIVASMIALADRFGMQVVVEGVESATELDTVRRLGTHLVQGYHLARPVSPLDLPT